MINLPQVTLLIIDCVDQDRAIKSLEWSCKDINFGKVIFLTDRNLKTNVVLSNALKNKLCVILIDRISSIQAYSKFMIKELYKYVTTDFVLVTQWDAFVLNANAWTDEFLKWDYIGAPWSWDYDNIGNGGFSLRSKKHLIACSELPIKNFHPEDEVTSRTYKNLLVDKDIKFATEELAKRFSFEGNQKYGHTWLGNTLGFHDFEQSNINNWKGYNEFIRNI